MCTCWKNNENKQAENKGQQTPKQEAVKQAQDNKKNEQEEE